MTGDIPYENFFSVHNCIFRYCDISYPVQMHLYNNSMENDVHSTDSTKTINGKYTYFRTVEAGYAVGNLINHSNIFIESRSQYIKRFKASNSNLRMKFRRHTSYLTTDYSWGHNDRWSSLMVASFIQSNMFWKQHRSKHRMDGSVDINDNSTSLATLYNGDNQFDVFFKF